MRDLLLIGFVVICAAVALRRPVFGVLTFVWLGLFNPQSLTWTFGRNFRLSLLVGVCTIIGYIFWQEPKRFPRQRESLLLLVLWASMAISTIFAFYPDRAFDRFEQVSKILLMTILTTSVITTEGRLLWLLRVIGVSLGWYALKGGLFAVATGGNFRVFGPEDSFLAANNSIGLALAMNVPILHRLATLESQPSLRRLSWVTVVLSYPAVIATYSRGAWLGLVVVTVWLALRSKYRLMLIAGGFMLALFAVPFLPQLLPGQLADRYGSLVNYQDDASAESRFWNWELCARVGMANPVTGGGFDFQTTEVYAQYYPEFLERWPGKEWVCHSVWFAMLGSTGVLGLVFWVALILSVFLSLSQIRRFGSTRPGMAHLALHANMLEAAFVTFLVVGTFMDAVYFDLFYYLVGIVIILKERIRQEANSGRRPATTQPDEIGRGGRA